MRQNIGEIQHEIDLIDRAIVRQLMQNGRISIAAISEAVGLSETACTRRIRLLEAAGMIEGYSVDVSAQAFGFAILVFVYVTLRTPLDANFGAFEAAVKEMAEVQSCHFLAGPRDFLLKVRLKDMADLEPFLRARLSPLPQVINLESSVAIRELFSRTSLPI